MSSTEKYWNIECAKHLKTIYKTKVNTKHLSEKMLKEFMKVLMSKYALSDDEILEQHLRVPFQTPRNYINISRTNNELGKPLSINFSAQIADISISVWLAD